MTKDRGSSVEIVGQLLRRIETLAVDLDKMRSKKMDADEQANVAWNMQRQCEDAVPCLKAAMAELERLKKKHPKLVRLPEFMREPTSRRKRTLDDDIPF